ncbi:hypothetical protein V8E53_008344 [Lactarius tabidus]
MSPVLSIPLVPASCTNVFPEPEHASSFSSAPSHVASSCTNVIPEPESVSNLAFSSSFPSASPPELMPSHVPPSITSSPANVQLPELASPLILTSALPLPIFEPSPSLSTLEPDPLLVVTLLPDPWPDQSPLSESLSQSSMSRKFESTPAVSTIDHVLLNPSRSSSESCNTIPVPSAPLEVSNTPMPSHPTLQEQTLRVTPSQVMSIHSSLAARPTPSLEVSNAPVSLSSTSQEQTLGVTRHDVTHAVTSTTANAQLLAQLVLPSSSFTDLSQASPSPFSANSSSRFDPQSSRGENIPIHPTPPLETSLNVPSTLHSSPSEPPLRLTQDDSDSAVSFKIASETSNSRFETPLSSLGEILLVISTSSPEASNDSAPPSPPTQRPFRVTPDNSVPTTLRVGATPTSLTVHSTPQQRSLEAVPTPTSPAVPSIPQQRLLEVTHTGVLSTPSSFVANAKLTSPALSSTPPDLPPASCLSSTLTHRLQPTYSSPPPLLMCRCSSARPNSVPILAITAVLFSAFINVSAAIFTHARKFWRKNEHISNDRNDITMQGNTFDFTQLFQLAQYLPHAARLVFDPGGLVSVLTPHKDSRERKPITEDLQYSTATIVLGCSTLRHLC